MTDIPFAEADLSLVFQTAGADSSLDDDKTVRQELISHAVSFQTAGADSSLDDFTTNTYGKQAVYGFQTAGADSSLDDFTTNTYGKQAVYGFQTAGADSSLDDCPLAIPVGANPRLSFRPLARIPLWMTTGQRLNSEGDSAGFRPLARIPLWMTRRNELNLSQVDFAFQTAGADSSLDDEDGTILGSYRHVRVFQTAGADSSLDD